MPADLRMIVSTDCIDENAGITTDGARVDFFSGLAGSVQWGIIGTTITFIAWLTKRTFSHGSDIHGLKEDVSKISGKVETLELNYPTKEDFQSLERKIEEFRKTRESDIELFEKRVEREIEKATGRMCDTNKDLKQMMYAQDKRLGEHLQMIMEHLMSGSRPGS